MVSVAAAALNSRGLLSPTRAPVFDGVSICAIFGIARPRTRRLHVLRTRPIVQPSGSTYPFRLHAWNLPCVCIRRLGAEILPMESWAHLIEWSRPIQHQVRGGLAVPAFKSNRNAATQQRGHWRKPGAE